MIIADLTYTMLFVFTVVTSVIASSAPQSPGYIIKARAHNSQAMVYFDPK